MKLNILAILISLGVCVVAPVAAAAPIPPTVRTAQGSATGKWIHQDSEKAFLGLPYAAPPVGDLRWKAPQPPSPWKGVRDATHFGARCQQWHIWNDYLFQDAGPCEDCLFLNVYTPGSAQPSSKLPVMVWIHGGGFAAGSGSEPRYTDPALVSRNVIVVTLNYRLGVFGFLANEDLMQEGGGHAGNYGLMDMAAALRWVKQNIGSFGGDADNVTVFGESAGSFSVSALMAAAPARGLFQKAIGESGAFFGNVIPLTPLAERAKADQAWTQGLGANNLAALRAMPASALIDAASKQPVARFAPVVDGTFLTGPVASTFAAGGQAHVPVLIGWNHDERTATLSKGMTVEKWEAFAADHYGPKAQAFLAAFPAANDAESVRSADAYTTDAFIGLGTWEWLEAQVHTGNAPVYRYRFDLPAPPSEVHPEGKYAFHSDELEYVLARWRHGAERNGVLRTAGSATRSSATGPTSRIAGTPTAGICRFGRGTTRQVSCSTSTLPPTPARTWRGHSWSSCRARLRCTDHRVKEPWRLTDLSGASRKGVGRVVRIGDAGGRGEC